MRILFRSVADRMAPKKIYLIKRSIVLIAFSLLFSQSAFAIKCTGDISGVTLRPAGHLMVEKLIDWNWQTICNIESSSNGVEPETCKAIYSLLLTAQTTGKQVSFWFDAGDCSASSQPDWTSLSNWYFGPMLVD